MVGSGELLELGFRDFGFAWVTFIDECDEPLKVPFVDGFLSEFAVDGVTKSELRGSPGVACGSGLLGRISTTDSVLPRGFSFIMAIGEVGFSPVGLTQFS